MSGYQHDEVVSRYGYNFKVTFERDEGMDAPWKESDGHGPVHRHEADWKAPGFRPLNGEGDWRRVARGRNILWMYDWQAAIKLARKDGWGCDDEVAKEYYQKPASELTLKQRCAAAVAWDFDHLRRWLNDDWWWVCVGVRCEETDACDFLGGLCSDDHKYMDEWVDETIDNLVPLTKFERKMREAVEKARG